MHRLLARLLASAFVFLVIGTAAIACGENEEQVDETVPLPTGVDVGVDPNTVMRFEGTSYAPIGVIQSSSPGWPEEFRKVGTTSEFNVDVGREVDVYKVDEDEFAVYTDALEQPEGGDSPFSQKIRWLPVDQIEEDLNEGDDNDEDSNQ